MIEQKKKKNSVNAIRLSMKYQSLCLTKQYGYIVWLILCDRLLILVLRLYQLG